MIRPALKVNLMKKEIVFEVEELERQRQAGGKSYLEFLRLPAMSAGVYTLPAGSTDLQKPHKEDEMYYVVRGRASMKVGLEDRTISAGSVIFVAATVEHRFYDIQEELVVLVFFAPAES
jgi:mannose-6-phosphate isomerase-like protein (cupin superfamily)